MKKACLVALLLTLPAGAQSLDPKTPYPLQSGMNTGTVDSMVGAQYWTFIAEAGKCSVLVHFKSADLFGNPMRTPMRVTLTDAGRTWKTEKVLSSESKADEGKFDGVLKKTTRCVVVISPPENALVRMGGTYDIEVSGAVRFDPEVSKADPIVRTYTCMVGEFGLSKFQPDGSIMTQKGDVGRWTLFDANSHSYAIQIADQKYSVRLVRALGLCDSNGGNICFQEIR